MTVLEIKDLKKSFPSNFLIKQFRVLNGINITANQGEIYGFLGPNGAGKTTTIKCMMDIIFPNSGEILIFDQPHHQKDIRRRIGFLPENPYFYDYLNAEELLRFTGDLFSIPRKQIKKRIENLIERVGLKGKNHLQLKKYSRGMIQRIGLAQVLINDPDFLILDEPFSGLDPIGRKELRDIIVSLKESGKTIFFSSHILQDIELIVDKVGIILEGKIIKEGQFSDLISHSVQYYEMVCSDIDKKNLESQNIKVKIQDNQFLVNLRDLNETNRIIKYITNLGGKIESVMPVKMTLEEIFLKEIKE